VHERNKHINGYDLERLVQSCPDLKSHITKNPKGRDTINFFNPIAVKLLNQAILMADYGLTYWDIPDGYLCPPVPGRADYIHSVADLLTGNNESKPPKGKRIKCLDIGVGANAIYPIIGIAEYEWSFTGAEIDFQAIKNLEKLKLLNKSLKEQFEIRQQTLSEHFFQGIIREGEFYDLTICNPPFFSNTEEAQTANRRKLSKLKNKKINKASFNFGGHSKELIYKGGEKRFVRNMIRESSTYGQFVMWFSTLISKETLVPAFKDMLGQLKAKKIKVIPMSQGNKKSRIIAWTFLAEKQIEAWKRTRWNK